MKAKLRKIGTSLGIIIPRKELGHYNVGDMVDIIINGLGEDTEKTLEIPIIGTIENKKISFNSEWCEKHSVRKGSCGCQ